MHTWVLALLLAAKGFAFSCHLSTNLCVPAHLQIPLIANVCHNRVATLCAQEYSARLHFPPTRYTELGLPIFFFFFLFRHHRTNTSRQTPIIWAWTLSPRIEKSRDRPENRPQDARESFNLRHVSLRAQVRVYQIGPEWEQSFLLEEDRRKPSGESRGRLSLSASQELQVDILEGAEDADIQ